MSAGSNIPRDLFKAFQWNQTKEGWRYWDKVHALTVAYRHNRMRTNYEYPVR